MGTTNSPQVFVGKIREAANKMESVPRVAAAAAATIVKTSVLATTEAAAPGLRLSGVGLRGAKIGVRYVQGVNSAGRASVLVAATGPFPLIERDTKAHDILSKSLKAKGYGRARQRSARALGSQSRHFGPVMRVHSPGTKGKHPFERGVDAARPLLGPAMKSATHTALVEVFL